jgi:hypothetical protein
MTKWKTLITLCWKNKKIKERYWKIKNEREEKEKPSRARKEMSWMMSLESLKN